MLCIDSPNLKETFLWNFQQKSPFLVWTGQSVTHLERKTAFDLILRSFRVTFPHGHFDKELSWFNFIELAKSSEGHELTFKCYSKDFVL